MTTSLEDYAAMRLAGESLECLCDEYASLVLSQAEEIKRLKEKLNDTIKSMRVPLFLMEKEEHGDQI